jgi:hypothetical protein
MTIFIAGFRDYISPGNRSVTGEMLQPQALACVHWHSLKAVVTLAL